MKRKLLSVLLTFCLAFSLLPTAALADGEGTPALAEVSTAAGTALPAAVDGVITLENGTYVMSEDTTATIKVPNGKNATLDLNGKTLTNKTGEHTIIVENGATLTITGNGIVDNVSHGKGAIVNSGEVTLNGGTFERSAEKGIYSPYGNGGNSWYTIANYGTMEINTGVTVKNAGGYSSMIRNGGDVTADCNLTIKGGNFTGGVNTVKNDSFGVLTINGGNFSNTAQYVIMNWNKAEITAGTFQTLDTASAVLFTSAFGSNANYVGELTISGGEFKHASDTQEMIVDHYDASNKGNAVVTGGKFDADISKYIPTDYVQSADGTVEKLGETNAVAKVGGTYYKTLADAVAAAQDGDTITLLKDAELTSTLNLAKNITIDGQGKYTIKAANSFTVGSDNKTYCVLYVSGEVTLKDVTVNGNEKCRVIFCDKGKLTIDGATITNGKAPNFIGGVYMTSSASFEMKSGSITGNKNAKGYQNDEYLQYSSDLWIGANANGALTAINGGTIGNVFVNANAWSASNPGSFTMNGGTVTNLYVEHDANYGATFKYNDGTIEHLYLSKENGNGQSIEVTPVKGVIYNGGVKEQDLVTLTMKYNDGATADSTYNVASGTTITLPTPRRSGYTFNGWYDGSKFYAAGASYTVSATVTLNASWSYISSGSSSYDPTYSVSTPSKTEHGTVTVSPKSASKGDTVTVTVKPDSGYVLETLTVTDKNGNELTLKDKGNGKYTFTMPAGKVEVKATFMEDNSMLNFFYDVPNNAYFYEAVKWAVKNGITDGVGNNLFAPEQPCTRAQIVTFLWRAAGSPEPKGAASGMTDVVSGSYYEKAVAWAIENGITTGTTTSTFSPDATCTRAQAVTFLARALKAKAASAAEFSDVPTGSYFADAVAWAAANGVTEGIGGGLFGSDNDCTRGQIVTFLYRAYNK
ncbi:MAG: S-layer homology domain-containing protein [Oscillospiraceae bacterium]